MSAAAVIVMGCDPGLANFGWAFVRLGLNNGANRDLEVLQCGTIHTASMVGKAGVTASSDLSRRARELDMALDEVCSHRGSPLVICSEAFSYPRVPGRGGKGEQVAVKSVAQMGYAWGVLCSLANYPPPVPIESASPQAIKKALCGSAKATKGQVQGELVARFGDVFDGLNKGDREHAADALGAIVACWDTNSMLAARRLAAM